MDKNENDYQEMQTNSDFLKYLKDFQAEILLNNEQFLCEINKIEQDLSEFEDKIPYKLSEKDITDNNMNLEDLTEKNSKSSSPLKEQIDRFEIILNSNMLYKSEKQIYNEENSQYTVIEPNISIEKLSE